MFNDFNRVDRRGLMGLFLTAGAAAATSMPLPTHQLRPAVNSRSMIRLRKEGQSSPDARLTDVAWLAGEWVGEMPEGPVHYVSLDPRFGHMPAFVRAINPQGVIFYEICLFAEVGNSLSIRVKHFTPELAGWEAREAYIDRPLVERDGNTLYFDGITYSRTGTDSYLVYFLNRQGDRELDTITVPFRRAQKGLQ